MTPSASPTRRTRRTSATHRTYEGLPPRHLSYHLLPYRYERDAVDEIIDETDGEELERGWADLIEWLPHEELVNGEWVEVSGAARDDQADYFRSQLSLFARLSFGRNKLASSTIVELVPLEALLLLLLPETMAGQVRTPKL